MVDISTRTGDNLLLMTLVLILTAVINAYIFGQFAMLTDEVNADSNNYMNKLTMINTVLAQ